MSRSHTSSWTLYLLALCLLGLTGQGQAVALFSSGEEESGRQYILKPGLTEAPNQQYAIHKIGRMALTVTNSGTFGTGTLGTVIIDGEVALSCEYPIHSNIEYLFTGALWIGAVVGLDTLVSVGAEGWFGIRELFPDAGAAGEIIHRTSSKSRLDYDPLAISEQDLLCRFTDTFIDIGLTGEDPYDNRPHIPLNVAVDQRSYAWSYDYAEDFILFDYKIANIGHFPLKDLYLALYVDADAYHRSRIADGFKDDVAGFRRAIEVPGNPCISEDTVNIAYVVDNDGDPAGNGWDFQSPIAVSGTSVVRTPNDSLNYSFNWWISNTIASLDFSPRLAGNELSPFRPFGAYLGTPTGDRNKYYIMSHPEFDYDQLFTAVSHTDQGYLPPPRPDVAIDFANGYDTRYLLSFGPFTLAPGDSLPITLSYLAGDSFHIGPADYRDYYDPFNPQAYYDRLNFADLGLNARWARWVYDNPGYDTDGDGDSGKYCWQYFWADTTLENPADSFIVDSGKVYYAGDGAPDFRGAAPPPPPIIRVIPDFGRVTLRWNGQESENARDVFSGQKDFEGYRVYYSASERLSDFVLLASYDRDDFKVFDFVNRFDTVYWVQTGYPLTRDSLQSLYGDGFDPTLFYDQYHYFRDAYSGAIRYFVPQDWNVSDLSNPLLIHKVYPNAAPEDSSDTTAEGRLRYYEYEYEIPNLQPSVTYYFAVTAFDFGSLKINLGSLESSPLTNMVDEFALPSSETVEEQGMNVIVYPNPYRIDGGYANAGYENRDRTKSAERSRRIHFANLPRVCTIRIFSVDGDLVRQIDHYRPDGGPGSQHEEWNVISRNTQAVVTGVYIWHVQSAMGEQLGKLVIIK